MDITLQSYSTAVGVCETTASRRLAGVFHRMRGRKRSYPLAAALQTLKRKEHHSIPALVAASQSDRSNLHVEPSALPMAMNFTEWLPSAAMKERLRAAQNAFVVAVANSPLCAPALVENLDALRMLFVLNDEVLRFVVLGGTPPNIDALAPAFAVTNNTHTFREAA
ncbi:hypothetical protein [Salipiger aestuarii]|uniref:hypothetical protein n=1 Tax=Salipiger aestuarii TaxID=568098 RepID=UPI00123897B9|nr:hypothetical protein [Salipiger aestuarii]KAA8605926.1 hypothetical protein AL037_20940 [Salipiger aestuarii]